MSASYIPEGYHSVTPYIMAKDADETIEFLKKTFDATEKELIRTPEGRVGHGEIRIGDSIIMIAEASEQHPFNPSMLYIYVENVDDTYKRGIAAGGESMREPTDEFYGDRSAGMKDSSGNQWWMATHKKTVSHEVMQDEYVKMRQEQQN
jgi:PhnB protein